MIYYHPSSFNLYYKNGELSYEDQFLNLRSRNSVLKCPSTFLASALIRTVNPSLVMTLWTFPALIQEENMKWLLVYSTNTPQEVMSRQNDSLPFIDDIFRDQKRHTALPLLLHVHRDLPVCVSVSVCWCVSVCVCLSVCLPHTRLSATLASEPEVVYSCLGHLFWSL